MASSTSSENIRADSSRQFHETPFANLHSNDEPAPSRSDDPQFEIFDWYPKYQSTQRYFLNIAQHSVPVQALAAFVNILLPYQKDHYPVHSYTTSPPGGSSRSNNQPGMQSPRATIPSPSPLSLIPYLRRLIVTGMDFPGVLHGFFGDDWATGIGPLREQERRNYLFAAKSGGWASVKRDYDMLPYETVPFLRPLQGTVDIEIKAAERTWSEWLAMEDWMVGPRTPESMRSSRRARMSGS